MFARQAEERRRIIEEAEAQQEEPQTGNNIPEFTQHLMTSLEEKTSHEPWDAELRTSLTDQLIFFLLEGKHFCRPRISGGTV